jgi:PHP family Zn ribbon phosphoesterase
VVGSAQGITVLGTGDFTHPAWLEELKGSLVPAEPGSTPSRPELPILERLPLDAIREGGFSEVAEAIGRVRGGLVVRDPGFDGEYGSIRLAPVNA